VTATSSDKLTSLQRAVLQAMMQAEPRVYLSGGAALAGFHLRHRTTIDLDFFPGVHDDQEQQVNVRINGVTRTLIFRPGSAAQTVTFGG
jgi:hypothetical protein